MCSYYLSLLDNYLYLGLLGMVPPGAMISSQMQPNLTVAAPKPEDTIVVH